MVGFEKNDSINSTEKLFAGVVSGVVTRFLTQPLDILKLRTQLQKKKKGISRTFFRIFQEEGLGAFYQGHLLGQLHSIIAVSAQFYVYEITTKYASQFTIYQEYRPFVNLICGAMAGITSTSLVMPLEVIRIRQMLVKDQYSGLAKGAKAVYRYGGILAFYEGLSAGILQMGPQVAISFLVFSTVQPLILKVLEEPCEHTDKLVTKCANRPGTVLIASTIAGSAAGFFSKTLTYPLDLSKRRLQIGSHKFDEKYSVPSTVKKLIRCNSLRDCLYKTYEKEGIKGLFRGWSVTVYKAQITSIVAYTTYELICFSIRQFHENGS